MAYELSLKSFRALVAVADTGSVGRAAEQLHLTQPALSQHLARLTEIYGSPVVERHGRGTRLTEVGRVVVAYARDLQRCIDAAGSAVAGLHGLTSGRVRVGVLQTANMHLVPRALSQLAARHPGIHTSVRELSGLQIETGVAEGDLDLGIGFAPVVREGITVTRLYSESFVLVAHCEDGIKYRTSATLEDAIRKPLALLSGEYTTRRLVDLYCSEAGTTLRPVIETNTISSLLELVREGGFRTLLPYSALVGTHGRDLAYVPLAYPRVKRSVAILLREGAVTSPAATVVSALVREVAAALVHSHGSELAVND